MVVKRVLVALILLATGVTAEAKQNGWTLRLYGAMVDSSTDTTRSSTGVVTRVDVSGGLGVGGEYRLSDRLGLELSTLFADMDMETSVSGVGGTAVQSLEFGMVPLTVGMSKRM